MSWGADHYSHVKDGEVRFTHYPSLTACVDVAKSWRGYFTNKDGAGDRWAGGTPEQAITWATCGWPDGAREASERSARIVDRVIQSTTGNNLENQIGYDIAGASFDVGAYLSGVPECWIRPEPQLVKRAVSICINITASAGVPGETLRRRGIAVASLVLALQARGFPVTVDVCQGIDSQYAGNYIGSVVRVIDAATGSQLDIDRLVYAMAHDTMLRRIFRGATNHEANSRGKSDAWYGGVLSNVYPVASYDLKFGGAHLYEVERWTDGGEAWILAEFERQTSAG